jgi:DNA-binding LacI/PurR family transcriptional regulator
MASLSDVAREAGVSLTTASLVLNRPKQPNRVSEGCSERVRAVAKRLGYVPNYHARSMKLRRAETVAVAIDVENLAGEVRASELADAYFNHLIGGIEMHLRQVGYQMALIGAGDGHSATERGLQGISQRRFDGMIVLAVAVDRSKEHALATLPPDASVVAIEYADPTAATRVDYDERHGLELALQHLVGLGHRRLLWVAPERNVREPVLRSVAAGFDVDVTALDFPFTHNPARSWRVDLLEQARAGVRDYLARRGRAFTAIVAYNDPTAIGVCGALSEAGIRVPRDVSVIGFDDVEASFCIPPLTTVSHKLVEMGRRAAERVMEMVKDEGARERLRGVKDVLKPELVVRGSTASATGND